MKNSILIAAAAIAFAGNLSGREIIGGKQNRHSEAMRSLVAICQPGQAKTDLDVNNIRTTIMTSGDMWWDLNSVPKYEIPKDSKKHSLFAGALWIGGYDTGNNLKVAAMTYRQGAGVDFWPGPLDPVTVSTNSDAVCSAYDRHYKITKKEVEEFLSGQAATDAINEWPGTSDPFMQPLAPFRDVDNNGLYDPQAGDYPDYDIFGNLGCDAKLYGDQTLFWVFNDVGNGNTHGESGSIEPIGLEIQAQAFGFSTGDQINDMTFYNYKIINRGSDLLKQTFFGVWTDADLGYFKDDYVGCDVGKGLGYIYNGDENDEGINGYGLNPPSLGIDFFQGPFADTNNTDDPISHTVPGSVNGFGYGDGVPDNERMGMAKFLYYNNGGGVAMGDPNIATDFYNYLSGFWKDGTPFMYGGNAYQQPSGIVCDYMFPGDTDPLGYGTGGVGQQPWDEITENNIPDDRRLLQSAGPFTLQPGAVNTITIGAVWARASSGGVKASIELMKAADIEAQKLFNSCFKILDGPDAPDLNIIEMDQTLIFNLINKPAPASNNEGEQYAAMDPGIPGTEYKFQGYKIYQLSEASVSVTDLNDPDKARLVKQSDIQDGAGLIRNFTFDANTQIWWPEDMVNGADLGIENSFVVTQDLFALGDNRLINHKTYYYMAVAYAFNPAEVSINPYTSGVPNEPYLQGRRNIRVYSAIPHKIESSGTETHSNYGDGPEVTRIEGHGNGDKIVDLTQASIDKILNSPDHRAKEIIYMAGKTPVGIRIVDPLNVIGGNFTLKILDTITPKDTLKQATWELINNDNGKVVRSYDVITVYKQQIVQYVDPITKKSQSWGFSITVYQPNINGVIEVPGKSTTKNNGFLEATMTFSGSPWLTGVADADGATSLTDWIRSGTETTDFPGFDDTQIYEGVLGGTWAPYRLVANTVNMPAFAGGQGSFNKMSDLSSVDIILTPDKSKWTRSPVIQMKENNTTPLTSADPRKFDLRAGKSIDKNGDSTNLGGGINNSDFISPTGMGWFPGYAINVATGERLNIAYGEDSGLPKENGRDMKWNPTSKYYNAAKDTFFFGGKHYIYVFGNNAHYSDPTKNMPRYDYGAYIRSKLNYSTPTTAPSAASRREVYEYAMWVNMPIAMAGYDLKNGIPPSEVKIRLRVTKPYNKGYSTVADSSITPVNNNLPLYNFSTANMVAHKGEPEIIKNALDLINAVPNPYYAFSEYENNQLDNRMKITNLPQVCTIKIYTVNGHLIRTFKRDDASKTSLDWDLKNQAGIPVASGLYIIHVDVPNVGERILKWFGVMRPVDLDSF